MAAQPELIRGEWIGALQVRFVAGGSDVDINHLDFDRVRAIANEIARETGETTVRLHLFVEHRP